MLKSGDHVVVTDNTYGGTFRLFDKVLTRYGLTFSYVDTSQLDAHRTGDASTTRMLFIETPTNPVMRMTDLAAAAELAHGRGVKVIVDNTFASPCVQRPIEFGADLVVHSTTKYLNGHSDSVGGIVVAVRDDDIERLKFIQNAEGAILEPVRFVAGAARHQDAAAAHGSSTTQRPGSRGVPGSDTPKSSGLLPGLPDHPQHELAKRQMRGFGGMLAFDLGSLEDGARGAVTRCG